MLMLIFYLCYISKAIRRIESKSKPKYLTNLFNYSKSMLWRKVVFIVFCFFLLKIFIIFVTKNTIPGQWQWQMIN